MTKKEAKEIMSKVTFYWELGEQTLTQNQINEALDMAIKALEQQPCEDCISRQAVLDMATTIQTDDFSGNENVDDIKALTSVTPQQKKGRWIDIQYFKADETYYRPKCPFCSIEPKVYSDYCPNCGADMRESEENA